MIELFLNHQIFSDLRLSWSRYEKMQGKYVHAFMKIWHVSLVGSIAIANWRNGRMLTWRWAGYTVERTRWVDQWNGNMWNMSVYGTQKLFEMACSNVHFMSHWWILDLRWACYHYGKKHICYLHENTKCCHVSLAGPILIKRIMQKMQFDNHQIFLDLWFLWSCYDKMLEVYVHDFMIG